MSCNDWRAAIRPIVAVPPSHYFAGNDRQNALSIIESLKSAFPHIFLFDCDTYLSGSVTECVAQLAAARKFRPNIGLALPNAGYGLLLDQRPKPDPFLSSSLLIPQGNVFADDLGLPIVLLWDHLITQAPQFFLGSQPVQRANSRTGSLAKIRAGLAQDNFVHYIPDSAHIQIFARLGILKARCVQRYVVPAHHVFLSNRLPSSNELITDRILFAGNLSSSKLMPKFGDDPVVQEVEDFVVAAKCKDWSVAAWSAYEDIAAQQRASGIAELDPDHSFFWSLGRELLNHPVLTAFRTTVFKSLPIPIDFYGGFTDPDFVTSLGRTGLFRAMGSVPLEALGSIYPRYQFCVDVTHTPFVRGSNAKVLDCFAAGGFMFVDSRQDLRAEIGDVAEEFMYRNADDLNAKIERLKSDPKRRLEVIRHIRDKIQSDMNFLTFLSRTLREAKDAAAARSPSAVYDPNPTRTRALAGARSLSFDTLTFVSGKAVSERPGTASVAFRSPPDPWAYIARMPLLAGHAAGGGWVAADLRVTHGAVGVGVLNRKGDDFLIRGATVVSDDTQTIFLRLDSFAAASDLVLQNWDEKSASEGILLAVRIAGEDGEIPEMHSSDPAEKALLDRDRSQSQQDFYEKAASLPLNSLRPQNGGSLSVQEGSAVLTTSTQQWAYAASAPLALSDRAAGPGVVRARLQVEQGSLGVGVLARDDQSQMLAELAANVTDAPIDLDLDLADIANAGSIVLRSWSRNGVKVRARIFSIETLLQRTAI